VPRVERARRRGSPRGQGAEEGVRSCLCLFFLG
jgi:hypothetical protein